MAVVAAPLTAGHSRPIGSPAASVQKDLRVVKDRLHALNNRNHEDFSFLNAVGAVWPVDIDLSAAGYMASTGFLIDRCHVLTNMHAVYIENDVLHPAVGKAVLFAVGQTDGNMNSGAFQGMKFLLRGNVIAHGDAIMVDHWVHGPENDWALIRLASNVDDPIAPMTVASIGSAQLPSHLSLSVAGFPVDHRIGHGDRLNFKDLWVSDGFLVRLIWASTEAAVIESTIQATRGTSGGPLYGDFDGHPHLVIGMQQGFRGNGIDVSEAAPNRQVFFTQRTLESIRAAQAQTACP